MNLLLNLGVFDIVACGIHNSKCQHTPPCSFCSSNIFCFIYIFMGFFMVKQFERIWFLLLYKCQGFQNWFVWPVTHSVTNGCIQNVCFLTPFRNFFFPLCLSRKVQEIRMENPIYFRECLCLNHECLFCLMVCTMTYFYK